MKPREQYQLTAFPSDLGWGALVATSDEVVQMVLGHPSAAAALAAVDVALKERAAPRDTWDWLVTRVQDYARGRPVDFRDVPISVAGRTPFQQAILHACRKIPYGHTRSYGELAEMAGSPRAARAVGSTMAANRQTLLVPCHRVIAASGKPGGFGGPAGVRFKCRLLALETAGLVRHGKPARGRTAGR